MEIRALKILPTPSPPPELPLTCQPTECEETHEYASTEKNNLALRFFFPVQYA